MSPEKFSGAGRDAEQTAQAVESAGTSTEKYDRKQSIIIDAATPVFTELGLGRARLSDVGRKVGLKTTSITYYFKRKEDLAAACYLRTIDTFAQLAELAITSRDGDGDAVQKVFELYFDLLARIRSGAHPALMVFDEILNLQDARAAEVFAAYTDMARAFRRMVQAASPRAMDRQESNAASYILLSQLFWVPAWIDRYTPDGYGRLAKCMYDLYVHGVAGKGCLWRNPPVRRFPVPESSRDVFLKAASELINSRGYGGTSIDRIAERLNLTKGSFYHHYDSKDELGLACFDRSVRTILAVIDEAVASDRSHCDQLLQILGNLVRFQLDEAGPLLSFGAVRTLAPELRERVYAGSRHCIDRIADILIDGISEGSLRAVNPLVASQVFALSITAAHELKRWIPGVNGENALDLYVRPLLTGVLSARLPDVAPASG